MEIDPLVACFRAARCVAPRATEYIADRNLRLLPNSPTRAFVCLFATFFVLGNIYASIVGEQWVRRYSNAAGSSDVASKIALDSQGNVIVAGYTFGFVSETDTLVVKYSNDGTLLWANRYNGPQNSTDEIRALAVDNAGNVFVAGDSYNNTDNDLLMLAYSSSGVPLWTNRFDGIAHSNDVAVAIGTDVDGNVYVSGFTEKPGGSNNFDYVTIKYSQQGVPLWTNYYDGPVHGSDYPTALKVAAGKVFVTGNSVGSEGTSDFVTLAYSQSGVPLWTNRFNGTGNSGDYPDAITLDSSGNVYVVGSAALALSADGVPLWTNYISANATSVAVDNSGNVFVAVTGFTTDYQTIAYNNAGVPLWTNRLAGGIPYATAVDNAGKVFVTGYSYITSVNHDYVTVAYSTAGATLWARPYDGIRNSTDEAKAIAGAV